MIIYVVHTEDTDGHGGPQRRTFWGTTIIRNWTAISRTVTCPLSRLSPVPLQYNPLKFIF